ncbi:hypothetical protein WJX75_007404 [Coccomyxa subellipsoidea]|uniref:WD40 repeat-like protein n=1 Tax=Coccomyxa subellipsoidea TaxID=248742 RepID=A0ABR2YS99_9CHLO
MTTLVAGSYERFWFAYEVTPSGNEIQDLSRAFSFPAHKGPVKCISGAAPFVASGGADDTVHIYNAEAGKDLGFLMNPGDGAVTAVEFYTPAGTSQPTHLLSGAADGSISVWGAGGSWECLKVLKGHKKEVTSLSVHPSGLLALSTARDDMLRMWNMTKGRSQYKTKIPSGTEAVSFSPNGDIYALLSGLKVTAHNVSEEGDVAATFELEKRGLCMTFLSDNVILVGGEDGSLRTLDLRTNRAQSTVQAHGMRVRGVAALLPGETSGSEPAHLVGSAASDGFIRLWDLRNRGAAGSSQAQPLCEASTKAETVVEFPEEAPKKMKKNAAKGKKGK